MSKQTAPRKSEKKFSKTNRIYRQVGVDLAQVSPKSKKFYRRGRGGVFKFEGGVEIKYTKAVNVFGLVTKS